MAILPLNATLPLITLSIPSNISLIIAHCELELSLKEVSNSLQ